jgi:hypothetical protein
MFFANRMSIHRLLFFRQAQKKPFRDEVRAQFERVMKVLARSQP